MKKTTQNVLNISAVRAFAPEILNWSRLDEGDGSAHIIRTTNAEIRSNRGVVKESRHGWYRIRIPSGYKYHKDYFLIELRRAIYPMKLTPYCWRTEKSRAQFYVDDFEVAIALAESDRKFEQPDGCRLEIVVENYEPFFELNDSLKEKMASAMQTRYDAAKNSLDLSQFYAHELLQNNYCPINRPQIMSAAIDIIVNSVPGLETLNLSNNRIFSLYYLKDFGKQLPNLKALYLANNMITALSSMQFIKQTKIVELALTGNPFCKQYKEDGLYISEIRKRLPKLRKVDGIELPPQIGFDIDDECVELPPPQYTFFVDQTGCDVAKSFLINYFTIYDSSNRHPLEMAYHDQALFSLTTNNDKTRFAEYQQFDRNLKYIYKLDTKVSQLKNGKNKIVPLLLRLPATRHDPRSFTLDLMLYTENLILLTVTGIFCEEHDRQASVLNEPFPRFFHRSFVIAKKDGGGVCILNDMLHVNKLTRAQEKATFINADSPSTPEVAPKASTSYAFKVPHPDDME